MADNRFGNSLAGGPIRRGENNNIHTLGANVPGQTPNKVKNQGGFGGGFDPPPNVSGIFTRPDPALQNIAQPGDAFVDRNLTPGATGTAWGDSIRSIAEQFAGGGGGGPGPAPPTPLTPQMVTAPQAGPFSPAVAANINAPVWQGLPGGPGQPGPGPGGGGIPGTGGPPADPFATTNVDIGGIGFDPTQVGAIDPITGQPLSQNFQDFNQNLFGQVSDFMGQPTGYSDEEFALLRGQDADRIFGGAEANDAALLSQLSQAGLAGGGAAGQALFDNQNARLDRAADSSRQLSLADLDMQRQGRMNAINVGTQFGAQQGQFEQGQQQLQQQVDSLNSQMEFARQTGNAEMMNQVQSQLMQLQGQAAFQDAGAANSAMELQNQLGTQRAIASQGNRTQMNIAGMNAELQKEMALNQNLFSAAQQNAGFQQQTGQFNAAQAAQQGQFNTGNELQAMLANQGIDFQGQQFNAQQQGAFQNAMASRGNSGRNQAMQLALQAAGQDRAQEQYNNQFMMQLLGMQQGGANNLFNQGLGFAGQVYNSNPNQFTDPFAGQGGGFIQQQQDPLPPGLSRTF